MAERKSTPKLASMSDRDVRASLRRLKPEKYADSIWAGPPDETAVSAPVDPEARNRLLKEVCELAGVDRSDADVVERLMLKATGAHTVETANRILTGLAALPSLTACPNGPGMLFSAAAMLLEFKPQTITESLLASQMIGIHNAMLISLCKASIEGQPHEIAEQYLRRATSMGRLFAQQAETLQRLQGMATANQRMTVEHVHVHDGGQAIVGTVERAAALGGGGAKNEK